MQIPRYCTAAALAAFAAISLPQASAIGAQQEVPTAPAAGEATFVVFVNGREAGREQVTVSRTPSGWTIASSGRLGPPLNFTNNRFEVTYAPDWQPIELRFDARFQDKSLTLSTSFGTTTAVSEITQNSITNSKTDQITARTVVLPNNFYGAYEALAVRLAGLTQGAELAVYVAPQAEIRVLVTAVSPVTYETPAGPVTARRYSIVFQNPGQPLAAEFTVDGRNRFAKLEFEAGALTVTRQDLAGVATRQRTVKNPTDVPALIPAAGFSLAGTLTTPAAQGRLRHPAVVLIPGSGPGDRDAVVAGIPLFAQLAGQLADLGYVVIRYDKRGIGQSGGRTETATLRDYADDSVAVAKWLAKRKDVDNKRIIAVGHGEGAAVALLAAREKRITSLVLMGGMGTTGKELILEQQQQALEESKADEAERAKKIELQKQILEAAIAEKGWEALPPDVRPVVDTPWYRSLLLFDPQRAFKDIKQPVLILHGALDRQVRQHHADRLAELARARKNPPPVAMKLLPSLNHHFVEAKTGDIAEYGSLASKFISADVARSIDEWLKTLPAK